MARRKRNYVEFIYCGCGCGFTRPKRDKFRELRRFIKGHECIGRKHSEETRKKIIKSLLGNNYGFKGDNVGYEALHVWMRKRLLEPGFCQMCFKAPSRDLANITGIYNRDFSNWLYLCRSCHKKLDLNKKKI